MKKVSAKNLKKIKLTLRKSSIGCTERQKKTLSGLGLGRLNSTKTLKDTPSIRGMIDKVSHLVQVEPISGGND